MMELIFAVVIHMQVERLFLPQEGLFLAILVTTHTMSNFVDKRWAPAYS